MKSAVLLLLSALALAVPVVEERKAALPLPSKTIFQFGSVGTWIENLFIRENGDLLMTLLTPGPMLYLVEKPYTTSPKATMLYQFPGVQGLLGITETRPNTYLVASGNFTNGIYGVPNSFVVWEVSLPATADKVASVRKVVSMPQALFLNGVLAIPACPGVVLIADSTLGVVFRVDSNSGKYETAFNYTEMVPPAGAPIPLGINGIKLRGSYLYFDNSVGVELFRIRITADGYPAPGAKVEKVISLSSIAPVIDDFAFGRDGTIWACTNAGNTVIEIPETKGVYGPGTVVVGSATTLTVAGDTAAAFGRTAADCDTLYVVTAGALGAPVNGTVTEPGKVVAIDTRPK